MAEYPEELKHELLAMLDGGPPPVTAEEAMARAKAGKSPRTHIRATRARSWISLEHSRGRLAAAISFAVVLALLAVVLTTSINSGGSGNTQALRAHGRGGSRTPPALMSGPALLATSVPATVFAHVGLPAEIVNHPEKVTGHSALVARSLPELVYVWASYCPFCAAENWAIAMALSRFGTFRRLTITYSSVTDFAPDTATLSFHGASYSSPYLVFESYDLATNQPASSPPGCNVNGYACLQKAPAPVTNLFQTLGGGSFPFMDFGNMVSQAGAGFENEPLVLAGLTPGRIAMELSDPSSKVALAEVGSANYLIAAICAMTGNHPAQVCSTTVVERAETKEASTR